MIVQNSIEKASIAHTLDFPRLSEHWIEKPLEYLSDMSLAPKGNKVALTAGIRALELGAVIGKQTAGARGWLSGGNSVLDGGIARVTLFPVFATADDIK